MVFTLFLGERFLPVGVSLAFLELLEISREDCFCIWLGTSTLEVEYLRSILATLEVVRSAN